MPPSSKKRSTRKSGQAPAKTTIWQWNHIHLVVFLLLITLLLSLGIGTLLYWFISLDIPDVSSIERYQPAATTVILDDRGQIVERLHSQNRFLLPLGRLPDYLVNAFVAAEDARFYQHGGVDAWSTLRALLNNLRQGSKSQGGSTITQQVTRSLLLSREKTYIRKLKEAVLAYRIDRLLGKEDILYIYLNEIYLGEGAYGVEAASQVYFGKHAAALDLSEASLLAGLPQAPSRYSPFKNYKHAKRRQAYVLNRMAEDGYITATMARKAYGKPLLLAARENIPVGNEYFLQQVKKYVTEKYGADMLLAGGLVIETSLDQKMQQQATAAVEEGIAAWRQRHPGAKSLPQAALVAVATGDGGIKAMVGGTSYKESQFNRAVQARRQPGSAFKPFVYATALARNLTPATMVYDEPLVLPGSGHGTVWRPRNFNNKYYGPSTLRDGLVHSLNCATIKVLQEVGLDNVVLLARELGIKSPLQRNLSLALGASEVSLLELTGAYGAFGSKGKYREPYQIKRILDRSGKVLERHKKRVVPVLDERVAYQLTSILQEVISEGTGKKAGGLPIAAAGKTGTTDQNKDAWFIGYTPELSVGVWLGFDQELTLGKGETGGRAAAPVWRQFMGGMADGAKEKEFSMPDGISLVPVDLETGELVSYKLDGRERKISREVFLSGKIPEEVRWLKTDHLRNNRSF
jgi:penicillin-binding protein 1A